MPSCPVIRALADLDAALAPVRAAAEGHRGGGLSLGGLLLACRDATSADDAISAVRAAIAHYAAAVDEIRRSDAGPTAPEAAAPAPTAPQPEADQRSDTASDRPTGTRSGFRRFDHDEAARLRTEGASWGRLAAKFGVSAAAMREAVWRVERRRSAVPLAARAAPPATAAALFSQADRQVEAVRPAADIALPAPAATPTAPSVPVGPEADLESDTTAALGVTKPFRAEDERVLAAAGGRDVLPAEAGRLVPTSTAAPAVEPVSEGAPVRPEADRSDAGPTEARRAEIAATLTAASVPVRAAAARAAAAPPGPAAARAWELVHGIGGAPGLDYGRAAARLGVSRPTLCQLLAAQATWLEAQETVSLARLRN